MPFVPNNVLVVDNLSSGIDRNGKTPGKAGTPSLPSQLLVNTSAGLNTTIDNIPIEELEDSPTLEQAEQFTAAHHFRLAYDEAINRLAIYGRGTLVTDAGNNFYRVLSSTVQAQKGGKALLGITSESISFDTPPDEFSVKPVKLGLDIMKHPRYFYALMPTNQIPNFIGVNDTNAQVAAKQAIIRAIQAYRENPYVPTTTNINNMTGLLHDTIGANIASGRFTISQINPNFQPQFTQTAPLTVGASGGMFPAAATMDGQPNPAIVIFPVNTTSFDPNGKIALALAAAQEIIGKLWRMEDSPMVNGIELTWSEYYFRPVPMNLGCYVENPIDATPGLPDYFYSTSYPPVPTTTIFDSIADFNPQCYSANGQLGGGTLISWLRDADDFDYQRTWFKVTRRWLGAPIGAWDADIYNQNNRPALPTDYRNLILSN